MKKEYVSSTRLINFLLCPYLAKNSVYIQTQLQKKGEVLHEVAATFYKKNKKKAGELLDILPFQLGLEEEHYFSCKKTWRNFLENKKYHFDKSEIIAVESEDGEEFRHGKKMFAVPLPMTFIDANGEETQIILRGAMDLVVKEHSREGICIIDWKTGNADAHKLQADLYALAAFLKYGKPDYISVRFVYMAKNFASKIYVYGKKEILRAYEFVYKLSKTYLMQTQWPARFGQSCLFCELKLGCPTFAKEVSAMPKQPQINADDFSALSRWAEHLKTVEKCAKALRETVQKVQMEKISKDGEQVDHLGHKFTIGERNSRYEADEELIQSILKNNKLPLWAGMNFSKTKFETDLMYLNDQGMIKEPLTIDSLRRTVEATLQPHTTLVLKKGKS